MPGSAGVTRQCTPPDTPHHHHCSFARLSTHLQDALAQLLSAFQQHSWLWELLLRRHLPDLLQHAAAARVFVEAVAQLPGGTQARVYRLWAQQLLQPAQQPLQVPLVLQQVLLEQLRVCFHAGGGIDLPPLAGEPQREELEGAIGSAAAGAPAAEAGLADPLRQEARVALREQLPHLLHLLLTVCCSGDAAGEQLSAASSSQRQEGGSSGRASGNAPHAPDIASMQSAAEDARPPRRQQPAGGGSRLREQHAVSVAASSPAGSQSQGVGGGNGGSGSGPSPCPIRDSVLRHAVVLVSRLSDPEALHDMLAIRMQRQAAGAASGSDSEEGDEEGRPQAPPAASGARHAQQEQQQAVLSRRDLSKVCASLALIEVCLDGMLTLQPLAAAVHSQLHSKGSSNGGGDGKQARQPAGLGNGGGPEVGTGAEAEAAGVGEEAAAAAFEAEEELRHTAGLMLGMHRELCRLRFEQQQQQGEGHAGRASRVAAKG